ncbi:hypothetical protein [Roseobacter sinensis]|nr:hypothetical protein [Roseobacter sp. WL0113]
MKDERNVNTDDIDPEALINDPHASLADLQQETRAVEIGPRVRSH